MFQDAKMRAGIKQPRLVLEFFVFFINDITFRPPPHSHSESLLVVYNLIKLFYIR